MEGKGHTLLAPVFSIGMCTSLMVSGIVPRQPDTVVTSLAVGMVSILSCKWPDIDQVALKPTPIIMGTAKQRFSKKYNRNYYYIKMTKEQYEKKYKNKRNYVDSSKNKKQGDKEDVKIEFTDKGNVYIYYDRCKRESLMRILWSLIYKAMGLERHRGWQSHSPYIWVPIFSLLTFLAYHIPVYGLYTGILMLALSLGVFSHFAGDSLTLSGIPLVPDTKLMNKICKPFRKIPIVGKLFQTKLRLLGGDLKIFGKEIKLDFATASNYKWAYFVAFLFIVIFAFAISPTSTWNTVSNIGNILWQFIKILLLLIEYIFKGILKLFKG